MAWMLRKECQLTREQVNRSAAGPLGGMGLHHEIPHALRSWPSWLFQIADEQNCFGGWPAALSSPGAVSVTERCQRQDVQPVARSPDFIERGWFRAAPTESSMPSSELHCPGTSPGLLSDLGQVPQPFSSLMVVTVGTSEGCDGDFKSECWESR